MAESLREVAAKVVLNWKEKYFLSALNMREGKLVDGVETALKARDERAARIAETYHSSGGHYIAEVIRNESYDAQ